MSIIESQSSIGQYIWSFWNLLLVTDFFLNIKYSFNKLRELKIGIINLHITKSTLVINFFSFF